MPKLSEQQFQFAKNVARLLNFIFEKKYYCTLGEAYRTKEQAEIYAKEGKGIINSLHCKKLAIDLNIFNPQGEFLTEVEDYQEFGKYWENLHPKNRWGGRFSRPDADHFEQQLQE
jgi:hypothetical protein